MQAYGLTETSGAASCTHPKRNVMGSVGPALPGVQIKITNRNLWKGFALPVGEIAIAGGVVMKGYYNRPDANAEAIRDGWFYTGDLGYLDERGDLFITGRKKEMIVLSSGKNIYPEEIETQYLRSPFIKEICVMGLVSRPGEPFSERLHAVIVPDFDVLREKKIVNAREVIRFDVENLSSGLPSTKRILSFDLWPDPLPRTTTRKLKRFEIQRRVMAGEGAEQESSAIDGRGADGGRSHMAGTARCPESSGADSRCQQDEEACVASVKSGIGSRFRFHGACGTGGGAGTRVGSEADDKVISAVYSVRELVDTILEARGGGTGTRPSLPGWDAVLATGPDDPSVLNALRTSKVFTVGWFVLGKVASVFLRLFFDLQVTGIDKLPRNGPFILSPNHQSFLDGPVVASQIPWRLFKDMFYVGTSEIFSQGFFKYLGRTFSLIPVDRIQIW